MLAVLAGQATASAATVPKRGYALYATYIAGGPPPRFSDPCWVTYTVAPAPAYSSTWRKNVKSGLARVIRLGSREFASVGLRLHGSNFDDQPDNIAKFRPCRSGTRTPDTAPPRDTSPPTTEPRGLYALYATYNAAGPAPRFSDPCFVHYTVAAGPGLSKEWDTNVDTGLARIILVGTYSQASAGLRRYSSNFDDQADGVAKLRPCRSSTRVTPTTAPRVTAPATTLPAGRYALYATYNAAGPAPRFSDPCFVHYTVADAPAYSTTWATNVATGLARVIRVGSQAFASEGLRKYGIHFDDEADGIAKLRPCFGTRTPSTVATTRTPTTAPGVHVYYLDNEWTCCKTDAGTPHPVRIGPLPTTRDATRGAPVSLSGPYASADAAKSWLCSSHTIYAAQAWISNWANVSGVLVSNLPCTANA